MAKNETKSEVESWGELLTQIESMRNRLGCSRSSAWFRGHSDVTWKLSPTLLRFGGREDPDDWSAIESLKREEQIHIENWKRHLDSKKKLKSALRANHEADVAQDSASAIRDEYHSAIARADKAKSAAAETREKILRFSAPVVGERDIFDEYVFRSGSHRSTSSWEVLAEMRHHGVPTRLMDWTDRFEVALYFATLRSLEHSEPGCIWILNPYRLSKRVSGRTSIIDITRESDRDYYQRLLARRDWPFDAPLPIYPPSVIPRVQAQSGFFTVHGNSKEPLEEQLRVKDRALGKVVVSERAAKYFVTTICRMSGLNEHTIFRDLDSLGKILSERFMGMQQWREPTKKDA